MRLLPLFVLPMACVAAQQPADGPIDAPANQWTWVYFEGARCADGSRTGLGINPREGATDVVIFLNGGGACWDEATCEELHLSLDLDGYGARRFDLEAMRRSPLFDRAAPDNPLRDASFVFVPYCTGDLHVGTAVDDTRHFVGAKNLDAYLERLAPTFASAKRVLLVGTSAGGYGVQLNAARFAKAFEGKEVHLLADSAPLVMPAAKRWETWVAAWQPSVPEGCAGCSAGTPAWGEHARAALGSGRYGVISSEDDLVIGSMTGLLGDELHRAIDAVPGDVFVVPGIRHTFFYTPYAGVTSRDGVPLGNWVKGWAEGAAPFGAAR